MTKNNTTYSINLEGNEVATRSSKPAAERFAAQLLTDNPGKGISVVTGSGKVVLEYKARGVRFAPWSRVEVPTKFEAPAIAGFTAAYVRNRIQAVVYRANDKSGWLVVTPTERIEAANSTEAREVTNRLGAERLAAKASA